MMELEQEKQQKGLSALETQQLIKHQAYLYRMYMADGKAHRLNWTFAHWKEINGC